jgi:cystathionine beta-lyase/cystathionine gamma-synthase
MPVDPDVAGSVGIEDQADLLEDFNQALSA